MTTIKMCNCKEGPAADYQDKVYGKNMRVHNLKDAGKGAVCTVCGNIKK